MQREAESLGDVCTRVMLAIALNQPHPADRDAMLAIMVADGHLTPEQVRLAA